MVRPPRRSARTAISCRREGVPVGRVGIANLKGMIDGARGPPALVTHEKEIRRAEDRARTELAVGERIESRPKTSKPRRRSTTQRASWGTRGSPLGSNARRGGAREGRDRHNRHRRRENRHRYGRNDRTRQPRLWGPRQDDRTPPRTGQQTPPEPAGALLTQHATLANQALASMITQRWEPMSRKCRREPDERCQCGAAPATRRHRTG